MNYNFKIIKKKKYINNYIKLYYLFLFILYLL